MTDVHSVETRSYNMSRIRSKDTRPEKLVRKYLFSRGFRYRLHDKKLPGKPDIVLPKYKTIIFIHGCFWHGHAACRYYVVPKTRTEWWLNKINTNKRKDSQAEKTLLESGWQVLNVWECELKSPAIDQTLSGLMATIISGKNG
jgi:DNA mismatch endonuclease (patch repair protein)